MSALHSLKPPYKDAKWKDANYMKQFLAEAGRIVEEHIVGWGADAVKNEDFARAVKDRPKLGRYTNAYGLCGTAVALSSFRLTSADAFPTEKIVRDALKAIEKRIADESTEELTTASAVPL